MSSQITRNLKHNDNIYELIAKIILILIVVYILYYIVSYIHALLICGCNNHGRFLVQEGFATSDFQSSKEYFDLLSKNCEVIQKKIDSLSPKIDILTNSFNNLSKNICSITLQIDESLAGDYVSNIPNDEQSYTSDVQKEKQAKRKADSTKYVSNLKSIFVKNHDNIPLIECFNDGSDSMTDEETAKLETIRENLNTQIGEAEASMSNFEVAFKNLQKEITKERLDIYYNTLNYNNKYLTQGKLAASNISEGFINPEQDNEEKIFNFKPQPKNTTNSAALEPGFRINKLEERYTYLLNEMYKLDKTMKKYVNTIKLQKDEINSAKAVTTDENLQKKMMQDNIASIVKS